MFLLTYIILFIYLPEETVSELHEQVLPNHSGGDPNSSGPRSSAQEHKNALPPECSEAESGSPDADEWSQIPPTSVDSSQWLEQWSWDALEGRIRYTI